MASRRQFIALLLLAIWLPFYAHCAVEAHCGTVSAPMSCAHHHEAPQGEGCPGEPDAEHSHDHNFVPMMAKQSVPPMLVVEFPAWMIALLSASEMEICTVPPQARAPDESPPHIVFTVAALPVRGPSLA